MVQNSEWGPPLWDILHTCASRCGRQTVTLLHKDEVRAWGALLQLTEAILPCPMCQNHYRAWLKANPVKQFLDLSPTAFHEAAQTWLWRLHNSINVQRSVGELSLSEAKAIYAEKRTADLEKSLKKLLQVLDEAKLQRLIDGIFARDWKGKLSKLRALIGI